jgi:hypothetical protein
MGTTMIKSQMNLHASLTRRGVLDKIPQEIVDAAFDECLFVVPDDPSRPGIFYHSSVVQGRHVIYLFPLPFLVEKLPLERVQEHVMHEIAHYFFGHTGQDEEVEDAEADAKVAEWKAEYERVFQGEI